MIYIVTKVNEIYDEELDDFITQSEEEIERFEMTGRFKDQLAWEYFKSEYGHKEFEGYYSLHKEDYSQFEHLGSCTQTYLFADLNY